VLDKANLNSRTSGKSLMNTVALQQGTRRTRRTRKMKDPNLMADFAVKFNEL
jgi:hypothetical protein